MIEVTVFPCTRKPGEFIIECLGWSGGPLENAAPGRWARRSKGLPE
jgi:hypothetical protein